MLHIVLATSRPETMSAFVATLASAQGVILEQVQSGTEALDAIRTAAPQLVVVDTRLPDADPSSLVQQILLVNAMVNTAVISPLSEEEFHEKYEGLGVLARLPQEPVADDARALVGKLRRVLGLGG